MITPTPYLPKFENNPLVKATILCVCDDHSLLVTRCAVLQNDGYHAHAAMARELTQPLFEAPYDVAVLCSTLTAGEKERVRACLAKETKVLDLHGFVHPIDLLRKISDCCSEGATASS